MFKKRFSLDGGDVFKKIQEIRCKQGVTLKTLSRKTKIPLKHLKNLEEGSLNKLPDILYTKNIIKKYLSFFNVDPKPYIDGAKMKKTEKKYLHKKLKINQLIIVPRVIKFGITALITLFFLIYIIFTISKIFKAPEIFVYFPKDGQIVNTSVIEVKGEAQKDTRITINDQKVTLNKDGEFDIEISLQKGVNLIKISGIKRNSKINTIWRNVVLELN